MKFKILEKDYIHGGKADNKPCSDYDKDQLKRGEKVEMEHTDDEDIAKEIAKDHMEEFKGKDYYKALNKMEKELDEED